MNQSEAKKLNLLFKTKKKAFWTKLERNKPNLLWKRLWFKYVGIPICKKKAITLLAQMYVHMHIHE